MTQGGEASPAAVRELVLEKAVHADTTLYKLKYDNPFTWFIFFFPGICLSFVLCPKSIVYKNSDALSMFRYWIFCNNWQSNRHRGFHTDIPLHKLQFESILFVLSTGCIYFIRGFFIFFIRGFFLFILRFCIKISWFFSILFLRSIMLRYWKYLRLECL